MRENFGRNKRKIEEAKKARKEEKRNKMLHRRSGSDPSPADAPPAADTGAPASEGSS